MLASYIVQLKIKLNKMTQMFEPIGLIFWSRENCCLYEG